MFRQKKSSRYMLPRGGSQVWYAFQCWGGMVFIRRSNHCSFCRYLTRNDLFEPALQAFLANGEQYNLLNSAFLELIEFIKRENIRCLVCHIVDKYWPQVQHIKYVETFQQLWALRDRYNHMPVCQSFYLLSLADTIWFCDSHMNA